MATRNPAFVLGSGASNPADSFRRALGALISTPGIVGLTDLLVSAPGGMNIAVAAGSCFVAGTSQTDQGTYECYNDASVTVAVQPSDPTFARNDLVVAQVVDEAYVGGIVNSWQLAVIKGTASASPADPTVPVSSLVLARIVVPALAASITAGMLTDLRHRAILMPAASAAATGAPTYGSYNQFDRWTDSSFKDWICTAAGAPGTWQSKGGLNGFSSSTAGAPTTGTWNQFDRWVDSNFTEWLCTVAGTPGTWIPMGGKNLWRCRLYLAANAAISANTWTRVPYDTKETNGDPLSMGTTGASAKIVIQIAGVYAVSQNLGFASVLGDGVRTIGEIIRTASGGTPTSDVGAYRFTDTSQGGAGSAFGVAAGTVLWNLAVGDIITGWGFVGGSNNFTGGSDAEGGVINYNSLSAYLVTPT